MAERVFEYDLAVIGGGPAGMSAACAAYENGVKSVVIIEREDALGGILKQCIHCGFGLELFGEELTGPEFAGRLAAKVREYGIDCMLSSMVLAVDRSLNVTATSAANGIFTVRAKAVILAMGCRERPRGALNTPGTRPSGIFTAGTAQRYVNIDGYMPGKKVVILGSGDIGLIMARRMTLEGAKVEAVCEVMPYSGGLARNIEQCLNDFGIPLLLSHTVTEIRGRERLEGVTIARVEAGADGVRRPVAGSERFIACDTLLLSVGLIPENELTVNCGIGLCPATKGAAVSQDRETEVPGIYACGNVLHVHDLADFAAVEAALAGRAAAGRIKGLRGGGCGSGGGSASDGGCASDGVRGCGGVCAGDNAGEEFRAVFETDGQVRYTVPQRLTRRCDVKVYFRVSGIFERVSLEVRATSVGRGDENNLIFTKKYIKLTPGTMQTVTLTSEMLEKCDSGAVIRFSLVPQRRDDK